MCHENGKKKEGMVEACCRVGRMERFLEPCLLLLLTREAAHGYQLIQELCSFGFEPESQDPGLVYRHLRRLEKEGMVTSFWETGGPGPAKRLYEITPEGRELLQSWIAVIERNIRILTDFLDRYHNTSPGAGANERLNS